MASILSLFFALGTAFAAGPYQLTFKDVRAEVRLAVDPPNTKYTSLTLRFTDASGQPADPQAQPKVALVMKMGNHQHGSDPTQVKAVAGEKGVYEVTNVHFMMGGAWEVRVTLDRGGGNSETQSFKVLAKD